MSPRKKPMPEDQEEQVQTAIRLTKSILTRMDKLATILSQPGMRFTRSDAMRVALFRGAEVIEAERMKKR